MAAHNRKDLTGMTFGQLTVIGYAFTKSKRAYWNCKCSCGIEKQIMGKNLINGLTLSCGCYNSRLTAERNHVHGMRYTSEYSIWKDMKKRCYNKNHWAYNYYGGRGIEVCDEWRSDFMNFYNDMGDKPNKLTLDRIDNNGNYCKENCRWATRLEQSNNRRGVITCIFHGKKMTLTEISKITGVSRNMLYDDYKNKSCVLITTLDKEQHNHLR